MKSIKILAIVVGLMASSATLAATKTVYVPEPVIINSIKPCMIQIGKNIFINANHISSIYVGSNTYYDEKNSGLMPKYIQKPALIYIVGKSTHALDFDEPAKEQSRILELIQKTCK
jgi:hypothetical protein